MDRVSKETRSLIMSRIRSVSSIEAVPPACRGMRLRHQPKGVFGRPDFANKSRRVALFVDGDFWHGKRPWRCPKTNAAFWREKIRRNRRRDRLVTRELERAGWTVIRVWGSEFPAGSPRGIKCCTKATIGSKIKK